MNKEIITEESFAEGMKAMMPRLAEVLPSHISAEKFQRVVVTAVNSNPDLRAADRRSIYTACMKCAQDGLLPDGREAAFVIYNRRGNDGQYDKVAQYMPMIAGILKKVRNSGELSHISAHCVHSGDDFAYELGDQPFIRHKPRLDGQRGEFVCAYAIAKLNDGSLVREVMNMAEIEQVRMCSKSGSDDHGKPKGIWKSWYPEMARKTVLRRLCKYLPMSSDLDSVFAADDADYDLSNTAALPAATPKQIASRPVTAPETGNEPLSETEAKQDSPPQSQALDYEVERISKMIEEARNTDELKALIVAETDALALVKKQSREAYDVIMIRAESRRSVLWQAPPQ